MENKDTINTGTVDSWYYYYYQWLQTSTSPAVIGATNTTNNGKKQIEKMHKINFKP